MAELPLFPLNTVLFPGMPITLHIFEERYKRLVARCQADNSPFGVVLIEYGVEAGGPPPKPHPVGCTARITQVEALSQGRLNLLAFGEQRFRIHELDRVTHPYLSARGEILPFAPGEPAGMESGCRRLRDWVARYIKALSQAGKLPLKVEDLPDEPVVFANLAATLLQIPPAQKQPLLEAGDGNSLLDGLCRLYRREVALLAALSRPGGEASGPPFFAN